MLKPAANNLNPSACAPFSVYDDYSELPTAIKQAEQGATARAMADFTRRTTRLAFVIALGLLLLSLALSAAMGFRAVTRSQANYSAFRSDLSRFASADSSILELRSIDAGTYTVYLDSSYWENASPQSGRLTAKTSTQPWTASATSTICWAGGNRPNYTIMTRTAPCWPRPETIYRAC